MKRFAFLNFIFIFIIGCVDACSHAPESAYRLFFEADGHPTQPLVNLLALTGFSVPDQTPDEGIQKMVGDLTHLESAMPWDILQLTQGKSSYEDKGRWLRKLGLERWHSESGHTKDEAIQIISIAKGLGFYKASRPEIKKVKGVLLLGSLLPNVRRRAQIISDIVSEGYTFESVWVLSGERPLYPDRGESLEDMRVDAKEAAGVQDERSMMRLVVKQELPEFIEKLKFAEAPKKEGATRATTADTVEAFLDQEPEGGNYFVISTQPFALYQLLVTKRLIESKRSDIHLHLVTNEEELPMGEDVENIASTLLDNFARIFYELAKAGLIKEE